MAQTFPFKCVGVCTGRKTELKQKNTLQYMLCHEITSIYAINLLSYLRWDAYCKLHEKNKSTVETTVTQELLFGWCEAFPTSGNHFPVTRTPRVSSFHLWCDEWSFHRWPLQHRYLPGAGSLLRKDSRGPRVTGRASWLTTSKSEKDRNILWDVKTWGFLEWLSFFVSQSDQSKKGRCFYVSKSEMTFRNHDTICEVYIESCQNTAIVNKEG